MTTKVNRAVDVFDVAPSGRLADAPTSTNDTGPVLFAFDFDRAGRLVLSDAGGTANTFRLGADGSLSGVGSEAPNFQAATCWVVPARGFFYTTNTGSDTITGYAEDYHGQLQLLSARPPGADAPGGRGNPSRQGTAMTTVGLIVALDAKPSMENEVATFLRDAQALVREEPQTLSWIAVKRGPSALPATYVDPGRPQPHKLRAASSRGVLRT